MTKNRVFTDEELKEMGRRTLDVLLEAIDTDNKEKAKELAKSFWPNPGTGGWTNRLFSAHADWRHPGTGLRRPVPGGGTAVVITGGLNYLDWGNDKGVWKTSLPDAALDASAACGPLRRAGA